MEVADVYATATDLPHSPQEIPIDDLNLPDEEFTEADVLPFLLQAQDIIAKLESRVVELETDLSSIHRKYEHDRHDWLVGLSQKDQYIHHLSSKLQKLEFNSNQAIVLLNDCYEREISPTDINATLSLCLHYLKNNNAIKPTNDDNNSNDNNNNNPIIEESELEEGELERRQAAAKEWKQSQKKKKNDPSSSLSTATAAADNNNNWQPVNLMDGVDSSHENNGLEETDSPHGIIDSETPSSPMSRVTSDDGLPTSAAITTATTSLLSSSSSSSSSSKQHETASSIDHCVNCQQLLAQLDQQIEQKAYLKRDISALASQLSDEEVSREQLEIAQQDLLDDIEDIASSLFNALNQILMDEVTDREGLLKLNRDCDGKLISILQSWDTRESRLKQIKDLLIELDASLHQSSTTILSHRPYASIHNNNDDDDYPTKTDTNEWTNVTKSLYQAHRHSKSISSTTGLDETTISLHTSTFDKAAIRLDGVSFNEFQSHLKMLSNTIKSSLSNASSSTSSTKAIQLSSTPFMKRILAEDVEPCLFQNNGTSWWKSPWFKRKLMDAIANNRCEIQHTVRSNHFNTSTTNTTLSSSSTSSTTSSPPSIATTSTANLQEIPTPPKTKCTCCGLLRVCEFKMRLHQPNNNNNSTYDTFSLYNKQLYQQQQSQQSQQQQPWLPIDRFCRDRLVAVCDFYGFLSQLPQAVTQNTPILVMFRQSLYFRRKMALAKVGSIGLFNNHNSHHLDSPSMDSKRSSQRLNSNSGSSSNGSIRRRSRSSKRESIVLDHSGNASDTGSVVSLSDIQGLDGTSQIVIVH